MNAQIIMFDNYEHYPFNETKIAIRVLNIHTVQDSGKKLTCESLLVSHSSQRIEKRWDTRRRGHERREHISFELNTRSISHLFQSFSNHFLPVEISNYFIIYSFHFKLVPFSIHSTPRRTDRRKSTCLQTKFFLSKCAKTSISVK